MSMRLTVNLASPCLFSFMVTAVYLLTCRLYINWAHSIMAALIIITVQQNWCLPFEHDCLYLLALALFFLCALVNILSVQSYSTAPLFGCVLNVLCYSFTRHWCRFLATWFTIWFSVKFGYSSTLCLRGLATLEITLPIVKKK